MLLCVAVFSLMDAALKTLSAHYPPFQVAALRGASSLPWLLAWALLSTGIGPLLRVRWPLHLLRGALGILMMAAFVYALRTLPLSTAYSIFFVAPLLITALSVRHPNQRSEEHTSELQSLMRISYAVFCLKQKNTMYNQITIRQTICKNKTHK